MPCSALGQTRVLPDTVYTITDPISGTIAYCVPPIAAAHYRFLYNYCSQSESLWRIYQKQIALYQREQTNLAHQLSVQTALTESHAQEIQILQSSLELTTSEMKRQATRLKRERRRKTFWKTTSIAGPTILTILYLIRP